MDPYEVLGLTQDATEEEIKQAYRSLCQKHHPDKQGGCEVTYKRVQAAYKMLSTKEAREQFLQTGGDPKKKAAIDVLENCLLSYLRGYNYSLSQDYKKLVYEALNKKKLELNRETAQAASRITALEKLLSKTTKLPGQAVQALKTELECYKTDVCSNDSFVEVLDEAICMLHTIVIDIERGAPTDWAPGWSAMRNDLL